MKFISRLSTQNQPAKIAAELTNNLSGEFTSGFLFLSELSQEAAAETLSLLRKQLKVKTLIGCTCAGVIGSDAEIEREPATTLILGNLPEAKITPFIMTQNTLEELQKAQDWYNYLNVFPNEQPKFILLPDPFSVDMNYFLSGLNAAYPGCPVMGGLASAATAPRENLLFINDETYDEGVVGITLVGGIDIKTIVSQGCRPFGENYIITKAEKNIIYKLAGRPFINVLEEVLQKATARDKMLAQEALLVGIAMDEYTHNLKRGDFIIRNLIGVDQDTGAGVIAEYVKPGQTIQFHVRDAETASEDLNELLDQQNAKTPNARPKGALVFSCNGRGENLFHKKNHEISIIQKHLGPVPAAGFFCAGEIGPVGKSNFLHGFTSSIALFYSSSGAK